VTETFPRQKAATRNFQLGAPRTFHINADVSVVTFLRSEHGRDAVNSLWVFDTVKNIERKVADARDLVAGSEDVPAAERARRERMRETTAGITSYSVDKSGNLVTFALSGQLYSGDLKSGTFVCLEVTGPIIDPHMSPDGAHIMWSTGTEVRICARDGSNERVIAHDGADNVTWGLADFVAAEELGRMTGMWWSPTGEEILVTRVDDSQVNTWWISDPATPENAPHEQRYPAAGTPNAVVQLFRIALDGTKSEIKWDQNLFEYLVRISWSESHEPLITLSTRDQKRFVHFTANGTVLESVADIRDECFIDVIPGQPRWVDNQLLTVIDNSESDTRELQLDGRTMSPRGLQVMSVLSADDDGIDVIVTDNALDRRVARIALDGSVTFKTHEGMASATAPTSHDDKIFQVISQSRLSDHSRSWTLMCDGQPIHEFDSHAESPALQPRVNYLTTGDHNVHTAVLFPLDHVPGSRKLPVLMRPYGGPHGAQVLNSALIYAEDQWFADQGYCVVIADNRGTPGRGPIWDRTVTNDFVQPVLDDQVAAVQAVGAHFPDDVDLDRVGIIGWSFGGYLAALAVMERPDVFHVAVAGAPVIEWKWYDTGYTERYLGNPTTADDVYHHNSLLWRAEHLTRPLMLVHGLADDNVVAAHTLRLSSELLAHGKPHTVLPLSGVTHMTPQEIVAENLMLLSVEFFNTHLG